MNREFDRLGRDKFDLLIVGGGIVGASVARDAALRGLKTALVEKGDFASGTSGKSSKLAHGGLRYLEHGHLGLVRESCRERERLFALAPHLVKPLPFLLPYRRGSGWPPLWMLGIGLRLYDFFAGKTRVASHRMLSRAELAELERAAATPDTLGGALYYDGQMDDARLTLECVLSAAEAGAAVANHAEAVAFIRRHGRIEGAAICDRLSGREIEAGARMVVNAGGPWGDKILELAGRPGSRRLRPTQGIHLVYADPLVKHALIARARRDRRVFFIIPWEGMTLIGTTDTDFENDPAQACASEADISYLLEAAGGVMDGVDLKRERIVSTFAGVRPLLGGDGTSRLPSKVSREHAIFEGPPGLVSVLGGKFTTFRAIAEEAVDRIQAKLSGTVTPSPTLATPFPGAAGKVPAGCADILARYGARASQVLELAAMLPEGLEPICPYTRHIKAEVLHAVQNEMAVTLDDVLERRLGLRYGCQCRGLNAAAPAAVLMAPFLGWDSARIKTEVDLYRKRAQEPF